MEKKSRRLLNVRTQDAVGLGLDLITYKQKGFGCVRIFVSAYECAQPRQTWVT